MPKSIKTHIFLLILFILFAQLILTLFLNFVQKEEMKGDMSQHIANTQMRQARRLCKSAWLMCSLDYKHIQQKLQENLSRTKRSLTKFGMLSPGETINFNAVDTSGANPLKLELPELFFGQNPVNMNSDPNTPSKVVDNLNVDDDIDVTIWQRINPEGDMLRLSANWKTADGKRAVGTYEKISNPKWKPIIQDILKGREHYCTVLAVDKKFAALFAPLTIERKGEGRTVVGMVGLGFSMNDVIQEITTSLASLQLGNNGFIGIIKGGSKNCGSPESTQGELILGSNKNDQGTNLWNRKTGETHPVRDIVNAGLSTSSGKTEIVKYLWPEPDKPNGVQKTAAVTYFAPFDWVLLAGINNDEFNSMSSQVDNNLDQMLYSGLIGDFILMALAALVAALLLHRIIQPINRVVTAAEVIAKGNLIEAGKLLPAQNNKQSAANGIIEKSLASSETNALWQAMEKMTGSLGSLVSRVQSSTSQLVESAGNIRNNASSQKETMADFEAHVSHIAAAISEISATSQELSRTMSDLKENSSQAAELASTGQEGLQGMEQMLNRLSEETASISSRLSLINEKANNIDSMVVTITKVAEQTNLLSLNAAIEAEKAGEYGLGFSVVAREIRRLADQTALATLDIEQMVEQMRSSVSQGVMEMERFTQDVRKSVNEGGHIGKKLSIVIDKVQELNPRFEKVSEGMQMQSQGAQQISQSMSQLTDAAKNLSQTFESFNTSSDKLRDEADELRNEISRFRVE